MVLTFGYNLINVCKNLNLYPIFVLAWVLSEMLATPHLEKNLLRIIGFHSDSLTYYCKLNNRTDFLIV